jgi:hypothetical protein
MVHHYLQQNCTIESNPETSTHDPNFQVLLSINVVYVLASDYPMKGLSSWGSVLQNKLTVNSTQSPTAIAPISSDTNFVMLILHLVT